VPAVATDTAPFTDFRIPLKLLIERFEVKRFVEEAVVAKREVVVALPDTRRLPVVVAPPAIVSPPAWVPLPIVDDASE
jgi:hypothetical protein